MEVILLGIVIFAALSGGTLAVNTVQTKIEEEKITTADSFTRWDTLFLKYARTYNIPFVWLKAICMNESNLGDAPSVARGLASPTDIEGSKSSDGKSWGLMQVTLVTARDFDPTCTSVLLNNAEYSVKMACRVLDRNRKAFPVVSSRFEEYVIKSYNAGAGRVQQLIDSDNGVLTLTSAQSSALANAATYWARFQRNKKLVLDRQPELA